MVKIFENVMHTVRASILYCKFFKSKFVLKKLNKVVYNYLRLNIIVHHKIIKNVT